MPTGAACEPGATTAGLSSADRQQSTHLKTPSHAASAIHEVKKRSFEVGVCQCRRSSCGSVTGTRDSPKENQAVMTGSASFTVVL